MGVSMIFTLPYIPFFLLLHLPYLLSTSAGFSHNCSESQFCGNLSISYPFFNYKYWGCGLEVLRCRNGSITVIYSGDGDVDGGTIYKVQSIDYSKRILKVHDQRFSQPDHLNDSDKCKFWFNNFTTMSPIFSHLSAQVISPILTLRVCKHPLQRLNGAPPRVGGSDEYCTVEGIPDEPDASAPPPSPQGFLLECKVVHLPVDMPPSKFHGPIYRNSKLYNVGFHLKWSLPIQCLQCEKNRTRCVWQSFHDQDKENFSCIDPNETWNQEKGHRNQMKIIGIGISAGTAAGFLSCLFSFTFYKYRIGHKIGRVRSSSLKIDLGKGSANFGVPIFSYAELEEATNNFSSVNKLGDGCFATVYHGKLRDRRVVAIKRLYHNDYKHVERFMNEIEIITRLHHQNLGTLYGCTSYHNRKLLLVYEFIPNGTVANHLHGDSREVGSLLRPVRMNIAMEIASALSYLHASNVIHRDVKTSNILLDNHFHVKVADFGLSRLLPTDVSHVSTSPQETPGYVDPEYHQCYQLTDKSDVYSFGVVLIELISSKPAVDISRHWDEINLANMAMNKIQNGALQELVDLCLGFELDNATRRMVTLVAELAFCCLQQERELRPSMDDVLKILMKIGVDQEYKEDNIEVMDTLASNDVELLNNTLPSPPRASPNAVKLVNQPTIPSANG